LIGSSGKQTKLLQAIVRALRGRWCRTVDDNVHSGGGRPQPARRTDREGRSGRRSHVAGTAWSERSPS